MTPLDVKNYNPNWDSILPAHELDIQRRKRSVLKSKTVERYVFPVAAFIATAGALLSSQILIAVAVILLVSSSASLIYKSITNRNNNKAIDSALPLEQNIIYRFSIYQEQDTIDIFERMIDAAVELHHISSTREYMQLFASDTAINAAVWQCATELSAGNKYRALEIVKNTQSALDSAQQSIAALETTNHTIAIKPSSTSTDDVDYAQQLSDNMHALHQSARELDS